LSIYGDTNSKQATAQQTVIVSRRSTISPVGPVTGTASGCRILTLSRMGKGHVQFSLQSEQTTFIFELLEVSRSISEPLDTKPVGEISWKSVLQIKYGANLLVVEFEVEHIEVLPDMFSRGGHRNCRHHRLLKQPPECHLRCALVVPFLDRC
jgi:hypothetical protein